MTKTRPTGLEVVGRRHRGKGVQKDRYFRVVLEGSALFEFRRTPGGGHRPPSTTYLCVDGVRNLSVSTLSTRRDKCLKGSS